MTKYSEIETKTAQNLLKKGFKWIVRDATNHGTGVLAFEEKPQKLSCWWSRKRSRIICDGLVPIFENVKLGDTEPTSLEAIVHPQVLDDAEKRYLSAVIKPFRKHVQNIAKYSTFENTEEYIIIQIDSSERVPFPHFKVGTMYKGMERGHKYTPEDLGL